MIIYLFFYNDFYTSIYKHQHWIKDEANFIPWIALIAKFAKSKAMETQKAEPKRKNTKAVWVKKEDLPSVLVHTLLKYLNL